MKFDSYFILIQSLKSSNSVSAIQLTITKKKTITYTKQFKYFTFLSFLFTFMTCIQCILKKRFRHSTIIWKTLLALFHHPTKIMSFISFCAKECKIEAISQVIKESLSIKYLMKDDQDVGSVYNFQKLEHIPFIPFIPVGCSQDYRIINGIYQQLRKIS